MKQLRNMINGRSSSTSTSTKTRLAAAAEQEAEKITAQKLKFASLNEDDDDEAAHRVRQNPKKTLRVPTSKDGVNNQQRFLCNKCGKAFQSSKAMCGHMACHSEKESSSRNVVAKKKLVMMESESDTCSGAAAGHLMGRSMRTRYKKHDYVADSKARKLDVFNPCLSEASGIEQEQEEVAICLMMLSRNSANWSGLNSIGDSSEYNSVGLEDRSVGTKLGTHNVLSSGYDLTEAKKKCRGWKAKSVGDLDSRHVRNGAKNAETDVKIRISRKSKPEEDSKYEPHLSLKKLKSLMDGEGYSQSRRPKAESYPGKGALNEPYSAGMGKRVEHNALIHSLSHQPFDVHVAGNKQFTAACPYERGPNSFGTDAHHSMRKGKGILDGNSGNVGDGWKKGKYESPVSYNDFGSGHKLDYLGEMLLAEEIKCHEVAANFKRNGTQSHDLIDLNLPAPVEDEEAKSPCEATETSKHSAFHRT